MTSHSKKSQKRIKRRLRTSIFFTTLTLISVLTMLGIGVKLLADVNRVSNNFTDSFVVSAYLREGFVDAVNVDTIKNKILRQEGVKEVRYISKEKALELFKEMAMFNTDNLVDVNPFPASFDIKLHKELLTEVYVKALVRYVKTIVGVRKVVYNENSITHIKDNVGKIFIVILVLSLLLFIYSVTQINYTLRLSIFSKRFIINTMLLIGANRKFIMRPFIRIAFIQGMVSGISSSVLVYLFSLWFESKMMTFVGEITLQESIITYGFSFAIGIVITPIVTYFSVQKYLHSKTADLYVY